MLITLGLVLVDPPIRDPFFCDEWKKKNLERTVALRPRLFQNGFEDFLSTTSSSETNPEQLQGPGRLSMFDDLIYYWTKELPPVFNAANPTLLSLSYYPLKIVSAVWMNYLNFLEHIVHDYEYSTEDVSISSHELSHLQANLHYLQSWCRNSMAASAFVHTASNFIDSRCENSSCPEIWGELAADYSNVVASIEVHSSRFKAMIPVVTSLVQIVDSRQSFAETRNLSRLTYLALVFVPLAYVSSLFSMSGETAPGGKFFWVYFAVSIPLLGAVFLLARPPKKGIRLLLTYISGHPREETKEVSIPEKHRS